MSKPIFFVDGHEKAVQNDILILEQTDILCPQGVQNDILFFKPIFYFGPNLSTEQTNVRSAVRSAFQGTFLVCFGSFRYLHPEFLGPPKGVVGI